MGRSRLSGVHPLLAFLVAVTVALGLPSVGRTSAILADKNVKRPALAVNAGGVALVTYVTASGRQRHVLVWGAVDALAHPVVPARPQSRFRFDYSGGWRSRKNARFWKSFANACSPYRGPRLAFFVAGCDAPDGSHWALQSWQRNLPMRGVAPWTAAQTAWELHLSHWTGPLPSLEIYRHWTYGGSKQGFFGRLTYRGDAVYGTRSPSATVSDPWARNISLDVYNSDYGPGWRHDTAISTHPVSGGFCYTFVPQPPPPGYPSREARGNGLGERYRISVMGPGVTPIVQWEGERLGAYDAQQNAEATRLFDQILGGDKHCARER